MCSCMLNAGGTRPAREKFYGHEVFPGCSGDLIPWYKVLFVLGVVKPVVLMRCGAWSMGSMGKADWARAQCERRTTVGWGSV